MKSTVCQIKTKNFCMPIATSSPPRVKPGPTFFTAFSSINSAQYIKYRVN